MNVQFEENDKRHHLYNTWWNMIARCYIPMAPGYSGYGLRGITVCKRWRSFKNFCHDMGARPNGMSLDRIDNDKNYSPSNCKWSTRSEQMVNRRTFGNNSSGKTGVVRIVNRYEARFDFEGIRYRIGRYSTVKEASAARQNFINLFNKDRNAAIKTINKPTVWITSKTKIRGITRHKDGGFVVRTSRNGLRHYIGYFKTLEEATNARHEFN